jgi:DNA-binding HxlR family transcriptional regulator
MISETSMHFFVTKYHHGYRADVMSKKSVSCPVETTLAIIGGLWKVLILRELLCGTMRFNELRRALSGVTHRTLTQQLRELEAHRVVRRKVYRQVPPKVEYSLTPLGESLKPVLDAMHKWGEQYPHGLTDKKRETALPNALASSAGR